MKLIIRIFFGTILLFVCLIGALGPTPPSTSVVAKTPPCDNPTSCVGA
ncbi:MAG: hypothetical protein HC869_16770 [Rhodospirillales bacterium]|nr:hypothetical protein [Rhodospirillales bacterium]